MGLSFNGDTLVHNGTYDSHNGLGKLEQIVAEMHQEARMNRALAAPRISPTEMNLIRGGAVVVTGVATAAAVAAYQAPEGQKTRAAIVGANEFIAPGSSRDGYDICKIAGTFGGVAAGSAVGAFVGTGTAAATSVPLTPAGGLAAGLVAGGFAYGVTYPGAKQGTEALCNVVLPDAAKKAVGKALETLNSALSFGGSDKVAQNPHTQVADAGKGKPR